MAGKKLFTNTSPYTLRVTLLIRHSEDPDDQAGDRQFTLGPYASQWQEYGDDIDIYLNGFKLASTHDGALLAQQDVIVIRGSPLDDELNMYNAVDFSWQNWGYEVTTREVPFQ